MNPDHARFAEWDSAYVLGALSPSDRREFEEHLEICDLCARAVAELSPCPGYSPVSLPSGPRHSQNTRTGHPHRRLATTCSTRCAAPTGVVARVARGTGGVR